ncbi:myopalladin isoform X1 [Callorhinchus milii]|uniref:myopalladin isoform X1 n=1 Tax=Callorhinchus milii TaxID=7868 RepID=UPI001C3F6D52|nr:myopalladin isoform X1 [Callorhinchus milii]XP_007895544.2 myopalladin isoform X1 [Callorhinchus milii]XP_042192702.1 myopalladin isoform X1 [Callorhinchus milii]
MQEENFEASTSISQLLRDSYLSDVRIHQGHGEKSRSEAASKNFYRGTKPGVSQDLESQGESSDLSAFLSQEELDESVNLAQQAIAQCSHESKKDNTGIPGNRQVDSSGLLEKPHHQPFHNENVNETTSSLETGYKKLKEEPKSPLVHESEAKKDYLSKAADFIEELSSLFKTQSSKRIRPRACKSPRSRSQSKTNSQSQKSSWPVDERERSHDSIPVEKYDETISNVESEEITQTSILASDTETLTPEPITTETQSTPVYIEETKGNRPRFIQKLKSREAPEGSRVQLDCTVTGIPTPEVRWYCEGKELQNSPDLHIVRDSDRYSLIISEAFEEDTGRYTCLASNIYGSDATSAEIYIEGVSSSESELDSSKDDVTQAENNISVPFEESTNASNTEAVHSEVEQIHPTAAQPLSQPLPLSQPIQQIQSPTNFLQGLDGLPLMAAPVFTKPLQDVTATEGQLVVLECRVKGVPFPKMEWYREETLIEDSPDFRILQKKPRSIAESEEICTLVIAEAFPEDSGTFTCTASNKYGTVSSTAHLTVTGIDDGNAINLNAVSTVTVEAIEHSVPAQQEVSMSKPTVLLKPKLEGVLVNHHDHKPKAHLRVHFKLPEDDRGSEPSFEDMFATGLHAANGQNIWTSAQGLNSPTKEPPPVFAKPKLDLVQLQQLHNQVLLEQQQEASLPQPSPQSPSQSTSFPPDFPSTMSVVNSASNLSGQQSTSTKLQTSKSTLSQTFNYARPKQFIAAQNITPAIVSNYSTSQPKQPNEENYFGAALMPANQFTYTSASSPLPHSSPTTSLAGGSISPPFPPRPQYHPRVISPTSPSSSSPSPVQDPVAFLSSILPSLPSLPTTNAMGLPRSAPAASAQGILKKAVISPRTSTDHDIRDSKDAVMFDLERKLRLKDDVFQNGQQRLTYEDKLARRFLGPNSSPSVVNFGEVEDHTKSQDFKYLIESTRNSLGQQQEYKVSNFEQRLMNEIEFRLERTPVEESDDEIQHEDIPTGKCIAPIFDKKLKHFRVVEGSPVTFSSKVVGIPVPKVYWFKDGKQISKKDKLIKMKREGDGVCSLYIKSATNDDDGNYTIMAANPQGRISCSGHLMVQSTPRRGRSVPPIQNQRTRSRVLEGEEPVQERFFRPHFLQATGDMVAHEGRFCRLDCKVSGLPNPDLIWLLNGKLVLPDACHRMLVRENGIHSILIDPLSARDGGTYTCIATNKAGQSSFSLELSVVAKEITKAPVFIEKLQNVGVAEGCPIRLECRVLGMPPPTIFWKKDNETISPTKERINMHQDTTGYVCLLIQPTKKEDAGWYTVSAKNEAGIVSCTARLDLYAQWHQQIQQPIKKVRPSGSRYAALTDQGLDVKSAFPTVDSAQFSSKHRLMESDEL